MTKPEKEPREPTDPRDIGIWPKGDIRRAFVEGAKWWMWTSRGCTMFPSERDEAETEAETRYPSGIIPVTDEERKRIQERLLGAMMNEMGLHLPVTNLDQQQRYILRCLAWACVRELFDE